MIKNHEIPEFQVIMQSEANAKFFVASFDGEPTDDARLVTNTYQKNDWNNNM